MSWKINSIIALQQKNNRSEVNGYAKPPNDNDPADAVVRRYGSGAGNAGWKTAHHLQGRGRNQGMSSPAKAAGSSRIYGDCFSAKWRDHIDFLEIRW
jgi:hypothetical protein